MVSCIARAGNSNISARSRVTTRSWPCWTKVQRDVGTFMAQVSNVTPVANRRRLSREIQPFFRDFYGAAWLEYFKAWKGNFGYGAVVDTYAITSGAIYTANVVWCQDILTLNTFIPADAPEPPGCWCQVMGCPNCNQIWNPA